MVRTPRRIIAPHIAPLYPLGICIRRCGIWVARRVSRALNPTHYGRRILRCCPAVADYDSRLVRRDQFFRARSVASRHRTLLAPTGIDGGGTRGFYYRHRVAGAALWRGGRGMGEYDVLFDLCRGYIPIYRLDTASEFSVVKMARPTEVLVLTRAFIPTAGGPP